MSPARGDRRTGKTAPTPSAGRTARRLIEWFRVHARDLPWRRIRDPYGVWVSEVMLQQTQVNTVVLYWNRWMTALPTIEALAKARVDRVLKLWEGLGYYSRARNLHRAARIIRKRHGGQLPDDLDQLLALPGVGRYTAGAIASLAFNLPAPILDGNVVRVLARFRGVEGDPGSSRVKNRLWLAADELVGAAGPGGGTNERRHGDLNEALMELGATICVPVAPSCGRCPIRESCVALKSGRTDMLPGRTRRAVSARRRVAAFIIQYRGRFLVGKRRGGGVNEGLWEFPNAEVRGGWEIHAALEQLAPGAALTGQGPVSIIRHSITRYRIELRAFRAGFCGKPRMMDQFQWKSRADLARLPFTGAHRRLIGALTASGGMAE